MNLRAQRLMEIQILQHMLSNSELYAGTGCCKTKTQRDALAAFEVKCLDRIDELADRIDLFTNTDEDHSHGDW